MSASSSKYHVLYNELRNKIENHILSEGDQLPSESELMAEYGISRYAVRKALTLLITDGLLYTHQGKGYFVKNFHAIPQHTNFISSSKQLLMIASRTERFYFVKAINGIQRALEKSDYSLTIKLSNYDEQVEASLISQEIKNRSYDGIFLFTTDSAYIYTNHYLYRLIEELRIPCITLGNILPFVNIPSVSTDDFLGGKLVAEYLLKNGHRRTACLMNKEEYSGCMRYSGFEGTMRLYDKDSTSVDVIWFDHSSCESMFMHPQSDKILELSKNVTAFFCFNDSTAIMLYKFLSMAGFSIPNDISIIGYDDSYLCETNGILLTSVHQDPESMGYEAANNMLRLIENPDYNASELFKPYLMERKSVRNLNNG